MKNQVDGNQTSQGVSLEKESQPNFAEAGRPVLVACASCGHPPESNGSQAGCGTENCWLRSLMGLTRRLEATHQHRAAGTTAQDKS